MLSLKTKTKNLRRLIELKQPPPQHNQIPIVNLTKYVFLSTVERSQLELGFEYSFINKSKNQRKFLAANLESICQRVDKILTRVWKRNFMSSLEDTQIFLSRIWSYLQWFKRINQDTNQCILSGDKDSCVIIMNKQDYIQKLNDIINEGMKRGTYEWSTDTTT